MEVVSLQESKSMVQALSGHNQVVFKGRWSLNRVISLIHCMTLPDCL